MNQKLLKQQVKQLIESQTQAKQSLTHNDFILSKIDYSERDALNEAICKFVEKYLQDKATYPAEMALAINTKTNELKLCTTHDFTSDWSTIDIQTLYQNKADKSGVEIDTDAIYKLASSYFFIL